jgi:hypothetical protein
MTYNIFDRTAPAMPKPGKGTAIVKLLLSQASNEMKEPLLPMTIPACPTTKYYCPTIRTMRFPVT